jgi:hypothetical protein
MDPNVITVLVKDDELTDYDFYILHNTFPYKTEYLQLTGFTFEDNIIYLN